MKNVKRIGLYIYVLFIIHTAFLAGRYYSYKNYIMMLVCLVGSLSWYECYFMEERKK
jgi:hypothetical protein